MAELWEKQPTDGADDFEAFCLFRDQQIRPRKLLRLAHRWNTAKLGQWCREHSWVERCAAYDAHVDTILRTEREGVLARDARENVTAQLSLLEDAQELVAREVAKLLERSQAVESAGVVIKTSDLIKLMDASIKLGRLIRGESTENVATKVDLTGLTVTELRTYLDLQKKIAVKSN